MENKIFKINIGGQELKIEVRHLAEQANADVLVSYGETLVFATAVMSRTSREGLGFFPLTVDYEEKYYAAGKIKGPRYIKRESRPSDEAICNSRLIDRAIRPLFPKDLNREVQIITTVLSWDGKNDPDVLGLLAASAALSISDIPWQGPLAALRIGIEGDNFFLNPTYEEREKSSTDLFLSAVESDGEILINMIESASEEGKEETILKEFIFAKPYLKKLIDFQEEIKKEAGKRKIVFPPLQRDASFEKELKEFWGVRLENVIFQQKKAERVDEMSSLKDELVSFVEEKYPDQGRIKEALSFLDKETDVLIHENILRKEKRPDGRKIDQIRDISIEIALLPRTHGSALFSRGQTKSLSILTLGAPGDQQLIEGMEIVGKKRFMHHYNFPPYSVGEVRPLRGPGRRDIGHGMLAEKAILPLIPGPDQFPYTIRLVSEILSSNGSSSMASVSSSSLALMDAGVPIKKPAAGIALGLISDEKGNYKILTDIQGPEDFHGDMDFKIAGTKDGITAIQMDVKTKGITEKILKETLLRGKEARLEILEKMEKVLPKPRTELSPFAPRILTLQINPDKIREVVGPGGKVINEIIAATGVDIDIQQTGLIFITSETEEAAKKAVAWIKNITREVKIGEVFDGKVKKIMDFGAFVEILPNQEGLIHVSRLKSFSARRIEDIMRVGDIVPVEVTNIDDQGKIGLSLKEETRPKPRRFRE